MMEGQEKTPTVYMAPLCNDDTGHRDNDGGKIVSAPSKIKGPPPTMNTMLEEMVALILQQVGNTTEDTLDNCIKNLSRCCLVSRAFCRIAQPLLFRECKVDPLQSGPSPSILQLLQSLIDRPDLARQVEVLKIGTELESNLDWMPHLGINMDAHMKFSGDYPIRFNRALRLAGKIQVVWLESEGPVIYGDWILVQEVNLYTATVCGVLQSTTTLSELDLAVTIDSEFNCLWIFFKNHVRHLTALRKVGLWFTHLITEQRDDDAPDFDVVEEFYQQFENGLRALYLHPGLKELEFHDLDRKDALTMDNCLADQSVWPSNKSDIEKLAFKYCQTSTFSLINMIRASRKLVSLEIVHESGLMESTDQVAPLRVVAKALSQHKATLREVRLYDVLLVNDFNEHEFTPCGTESGVSPMLDWTNHNLTHFEFDCGHDFLHTIPNRIPKTVEYMCVEVLDSSDPDEELTLSPAKHRFEATLNQLADRGFVHLARVDVKMFDQSFRYEQVDATFSEVFSATDE